MSDARGAASWDARAEHVLALLRNPHYTADRRLMEERQREADVIAGLLAEHNRLREQLDVGRAKIADAMGTLHVLQFRADRILNGHDAPSEMAHDIRRLRLEAHGHLVAARAALGVEGEQEA